MTGDECLWEDIAMIAVYENYRLMPMSLALEEMAALHREMAEEIGSDEDALELYGDLLAAAVKYLDSRAHWPLWSREKKLENDAARTSRHNMAILSFNQLARYLKMQGKAAGWRDVLGEEAENAGYRKRLGDFACYLVFAESLNAR